MKRAFYEYPNINAGTGAELRIKATATYADIDRLDDIEVTLCFLGTEKMKLPLRNCGCLFDAKVIEKVKSELARQLQLPWVKIEKEHMTYEFDGVHFSASELGKFGDRPMDKDEVLPVLLELLEVAIVPEEVIQLTGANCWDCPATAQPLQNLTEAIELVREQPCGRDLTVLVNVNRAATIALHRSVMQYVPSGMSIKAYLEGAFGESVSFFFDKTPYGEDARVTVSAYDVRGIGRQLILAGRTVILEVVE